MTKIFYTVSDNGDGGSSVRFFESQECIDTLEDKNSDVWASGEGGGSFYADNIQGIKIYTMSDVISSLED